MCEDLDDHSRTIIHLDMDCFYAQVEMNKKPELRDVPMGVYQKQFVITTNQKARSCGIGKCVLITDAQRLCPELVLVNGEDLYDYRKASYAITDFCRKFTSAVERLGLDENYMDVTGLVANRLKTPGSQHSMGVIYGGRSSERCDCGCTDRIKLGSVIAHEIREQIKAEFNLTTSAGIAHNKLLAKLSGALHKPNQQTAIFPNSALELMLSLESPEKIPGVGRAMGQQLKDLGVLTIEELQKTDVKRLTAAFGAVKAKALASAALGVDPSPVKTSGKPQSIGLEDACKTVTEQEVRQKLNQLLQRLLVLVKEDGRVPKTIKLTVRKFDNEDRTSHRESRQCNLHAGSFPNESKILTSVMHLYNKIIDVRKSFHITLLGLSFTKFQEAVNAGSSLRSFLKKDVEVQAITSIRNEEVTSTGDVTCLPSTSAHVLSEVEVSPTPSPKKFKSGNLLTVAKKRCFNVLYDDCESPSKLKVAELCLEAIKCPPDADPEVFKELPIEMQKEVWLDYKRRNTERAFCVSHVKKNKPNTLFNYFLKN